MKKAKRFLSILIAALLGASLCSGLVACGEENNVVTPTPPAKAVSIKIDEAAATIKAGETVQLHVTVSNADDKTYKWSISDEDILEINNDVVSVVSGARFTMDTIVTVTATANADKTKSASHTFTVKPSLSGEVGDLTATLFAEIADSSITFEGTVTDYYIDTENAYNSSTDKYDMKVMMEDGKWYGEWARQKSGPFDFPTVTIDNYRRGNSLSTNEGHEYLKTYIDKNNQVATKAQRDYAGTYYTWESQHLWNHLGSLGSNISEKWLYDSAQDEYVYQIEWSSATATDYTDDEYLMTYLAYSLTPILSDTLGEFRVKLDAAKEHIVNIWAKTSVTGYENENGVITQQWFSEIELDIINPGTTVVPDPTPYEKDESDAQYDMLVKALNSMKGGTNYTFMALETSLRAPSGGEGDIVPESLNTNGGLNAVPFAATTPQGGYYKKHTQATGTVGRVGYVTDDVILFEDTGMYSAYDGDPYYVDYKGYKQYNAGQDNEYYEEFATSTFDMNIKDVKSLVATRRKNGNMFDKMPQFDFSPLILKSEGPVTIKVGNGNLQAYAYTLRDTSLTYEIANEISASNVVSSAQAFSTQQLTIYIDANGNLLQTKFPYNIADSWAGYVTTSYADIGTTELDPACFTGENYIEREWKAEWSQHGVRYYSPTHTGNYVDATADIVLQGIFGAQALTKIPKPEVFLNIFGDQISGPFFDWKDVKNEDDEIVGYKDFLSITITMDDDVYYDAQTKKQVPILDIIGQDSDLAQALSTWGFTYSPAESGFYNKDKTMCYATYTSEEIMIVIENIGTKFLYIDFRFLGDWHYSYPRY